MKRVAYSDFILSCCQADISIWTSRTLFYPYAEAHSRPSQISKITLSVSQSMGK